MHLGHRRAGSGKSLRKEQRDMSTETNKVLFRRIFEEILAQGDLAAADELIDPGFVNHESTP
jgi:hypothetical protein